jgi:hypothetical protein
MFFAALEMGSPVDDFVRSEVYDWLFMLLEETLRPSLATAQCPLVMILAHVISGDIHDLVLGRRVDMVVSEAPANL